MPQEYMAPNQRGQIRSEGNLEPNASKWHKPIEWEETEFFVAFFNTTSARKNKGIQVVSLNAFILLGLLVPSDRIGNILDPISL